MTKLENVLDQLKEVQGTIQEKHIELQGMSETFVKDFEEKFGVKPQEQITAFQAVELFSRLLEVNK